ncbi:MAG: T9SS type A sorting domain-containing protein [Bizionia sp.]|nr:T9SS type A sorting domain-containing protein [Bizionia sp.]
MTKYTINLLVLLLLISSKTLAQTGPGGVGTTDGTSDLVLWLDANTLNQGDNSDVSLWIDTSGYNNNATAPSYTGPQFKENDINGYPQLKFDISNTEYLGVDDNNNSLQMDEQLTVFVVGKLTSATDTWGAFVSRIEDNSWDKGYALYRDVNNNSNVTTGGYVGKWEDSRVVTDIQANQNSILSLHYDRSASNLSLLINEEETNRNYSKKINSKKNETLWLGWARGAGNGHYLDGTIAETIILKRAVNKAERIIINNYLSAKYEIALEANGLYTQDDNANGDFDHNVAGIGKVDSNNHHLDSQGTGIIRISKSNLADNKFLFWGENNKNATYSFPNGGADCNGYIDTMWRVSEPVSINNKLRMQIKKSDLNLPIANEYQKLELVVADNPDFTDATVYELEDNGTEFVYDVDGLGFDDGDYFTLRYINQIVWDGVNNFHYGSGVASAPNNSDDICKKLEIKSGTTATLTENAHVKSIELKAGAILEVADGVELTVENGIHNEGTIKLLGEAQLIQKHSGVNNNTGSGVFTVTQKGSGNLFNYNYWSSPVHDSTTGKWKVSNLQYFDVAADSLENFTFEYVNDANPHNAVGDSLPMMLSSRWLYGYNAGQNNYYNWAYLGANGDIAPGIGYTMKGSGVQNLPEQADTQQLQEYVFEGQTNNGKYSYNVTSGYSFLIGNPYPSALDADQFIQDNISLIDGSSGAFDGTLYFYEQFETNNTHVTANYQGGYATYNLIMGVAATAPNTNGGTSSKGEPTKNIAVGQGFFINIDNSGELVFKNSQRVFAKQSVPGESTFFKTASTTQNTTATDTRTKFWLSFTDPASRMTQIGLGYDDNATLDYDKGYDAYDYNGHPDYMLWDIQGDNFVIQGRNNFNLDNEMPLSFKIATAGSYTIGLKKTLNFPDGTPIYLKDNVSGLYYNLKTEDATLYFEAGEYNEQYSIVYQDDQTLSTDTIAAGNGLLLIYDTNNQQLEIKGYDNLQDIRSLKIYNVVGQEIVSLKSVESPIVRLPNVSNGVYILEMIDVNNGKITKKFVKQ